MNKKLKHFYSAEIDNFKIAVKERRIDDAWKSLERAHVLGQFFWREHFYIHCQMLYLGLKTLNFKEAAGQVPRIVVAVPGSLLKKAPKGNVGTIRVGIFEPMPISYDLKKILDSCETSD